MNRATLSFVRVIICGLFLLCTVGVVNAQFKAGIQGTVTDSQTGAPLKGADVEKADKAMLEFFETKHNEERST